MGGPTQNATRNVRTQVKSAVRVVVVAVGLGTRLGTIRSLRFAFPFLLRHRVRILLSVWHGGASLSECVGICVCMVEDM